MAYPSPADLNVSKGLPEILTYTNEVSGGLGWFSIMLCVAIFVIVLIQYNRASNNDFFAAFSLATFVTFIVGTLMYIGQILNGKVYAIIISFTLLGGLALFLKRKDV